jgi:hypothetical protein
MMASKVNQTTAAWSIARFQAAAFLLRPSDIPQHTTGQATPRTVAAGNK